MNRTNLLWITCDEMKTRAMSVYGNPFTHMPAAERMAREGVVFSRAYCQMPKCVPSRVSMMTGRYPHCEGIRTLMGRRDFKPHPAVKNNDMLVLQEDTPNLVILLRDEGYRTCLLGKNHLVEWNLHKRWFDATPGWDFDHVRTYTGDVSDTMRRADYLGTIAPSYDMRRHEDAVTVREAAAFLRKNRDRPFFALVDIGKPHPAYEDYPLFPSYSIPLARFPVPPCVPLDRAPSVERWLRSSKNLETLGDDDRRRIVRAYYTMCEFADAQVGAILDELDRLDLSRNTLVIYTADHGDFAGEHNCWEKWDTLFYECIVNVPLMLRLPGVLRPGLRFDQLTELVDLMPTVLDMLNKPAPSYVQGRSLRPLLDGSVAAYRDAVFCQGGVEHDLTLRPAQPGSGAYTVKQQVLVDFPQSMERAKMVRTDRYKYVYRLAGDCELYDLQTDPDELANRAADPGCRDVVERLRERLLRFMLESETNLPAVDRLVA